MVSERLKKIRLVGLKASVSSQAPALLLSVIQHTADVRLIITDKQTAAALSRKQHIEGKKT